MTHSYDPKGKPHPDHWKSADEAERVQWVLHYHRRVGADLPNEMIHAAMHVAVENQVLLGAETPVAETFQRLQAEGLERHDAIHALGSVLAAHIWHLTSGTRGEDPDPNIAYFAEVRELTAKKWLEDFAEGEHDA